MTLQGEMLHASERTLKQQMKMVWVIEKIGIHTVADLDNIVSFKFCQTNVDARKFKAGVHLLASGRPF